MGGELPPDWRERTLDMIRRAAELDGSWFTGGPRCSPVEQIEIYRTQYRLRLYDALLVEVPGLSHLLGDERREEVLLGFLYAHPSSAWTLNRVADGLGDWLASQPGARPEWVEMARLDWAVQHAFESADQEALEPAALVGVPGLRLQPHVHLLRLSYNVHEIRSAVLTGGTPPEVAAGDHPVVVYRAGHQVRHWVVPLGMWGILKAIGEGRTLPEALDAVFVAGWASPEELTEHVGDWFHDMATLRFVQVASPGR